MSVWCGSQHVHHTVFCSASSSNIRKHCSDLTQRKQHQCLVALQITVAFAPLQCVTKLAVPVLLSVRPYAHCHVGISICVLGLHSNAVVACFIPGHASSLLFCHAQQG